MTIAPKPVADNSLVEPKRHALGLGAVLFVGKELAGPCLSLFCPLPRSLHQRGCFLTPAFEVHVR